MNVLDSQQPLFDSVNYVECHTYFSMLSVPKTKRSNQQWPNMFQLAATKRCAVPWRLRFRQQQQKAKNTQINHYFTFGCSVIRIRVPGQRRAACLFPCPIHHPTPRIDKTHLRFAINLIDILFLFYFQVCVSALRNTIPNKLNPNTTGHNVPGYRKAKIDIGTEWHGLDALVYSVKTGI